MRLFTSYFYMVRFFTPNMIPVSTAVWDPKWYHAFKGQDYLFLDKRGVLNGVRADFLAPGPTCSDKCRGPENCATKDPATCPFLRYYKEQLDALPSEDVRAWMRNLMAQAKDTLHFTGEPTLVLLVHEAPTNPCSERSVLQKRFNCVELTKEDI